MDDDNPLLIVSSAYCHRDLSLDFGKLPIAFLPIAYRPFYQLQQERVSAGAVAELVGIECGVVSGVFNLESSGIEVPDWRPRHDKH